MTTRAAAPPPVVAETPASLAGHLLACFGMNHDSARRQGVVPGILLILLACGAPGVVHAGSVQGTVSLEGGGPVAGVAIVADAGAGFSNTTSDGAGAFGYPSLAAGNYHVQAALAPYALSHYWGVSVGASTSTTLSFTMRVGGGSITGQVVDGSDQPIVGATVDAWQVIDGQYDDAAWGRATTDAMGNFTIDDPTTPNGLPTGAYFLKASKTGLPDGVLSDVAVVAGEETSGVTLRQVSGTAALLGRIATPDATGIPNAQVYVESALGAAQGLTNASGDYGIGALPGGNYHVVVSASGYTSAHRYDVVIPEGAVVTGVDFTLGTEPGTLAGRVTDLGSGLPIAGAIVFADSDDGTGWGRTTTDGDGMFAVEGLAPMLYYVHVTKQGYAGQFRSISVGANEVKTGNDFALAAANSAIAGQVTVDGSPVANASVYINSSEGEDPVVDTSCFTGSDGRYLCDDLTAGSFDVHVSGVIGYANQVHYFVAVADNSTTSDVDFAMVNGEATITGAVSDPDSGAPLVGAKVQAFLEEDPGTWAVAFTDAQGRYAMEDLWGGNYLMTATLAGHAAIERPSVPVADTGTTIINLPSGDGPVCAAPTAATDPAAVVAKAKVVPGRKLVVKGTLPLTFFPMVDGVSVVVGDISGRSACLELGPGVLIPHRGGAVMTYKDATVTDGITGLKLKRLPAGGYDFVVKGVGVDLLVDGLPEIGVGVSSKSTTMRGMATLQRRGAKYVGP